MIVEEKKMPWMDYPTKIFQKKTESTSENKNEKSSIEIPYFCSIANAVAQTWMFGVYHFRLHRYTSK